MCGYNIYMYTHTYICIHTHAIHTYDTDIWNMTYTTWNMTYTTWNMTYTFRGLQQQKPTKQQRCTLRRLLGDNSVTVINTQMDTKIDWGGRLHYTALQTVKRRRTKASNGGIATRPVSLRRVIVTQYADSPVTIA